MTVVIQYANAYSNLKNQDFWCGHLRTDQDNKVCIWRMYMLSPMKIVMKLCILLKDFEFALDVTIKKKIDMNWMGTFGMDMKKMRMVMYSASFVMKNLQTYQI